MENENTISFIYKFKLHNGSEKIFEILLDKKTLSLLNPPLNSFPEWTYLNNFKCPHCPLDENKIKYCPLAINLVDVVNAFNDCNSYDIADVEVITEQRNYFKRTSLQSAVSSMLGIRMVVSGCPINEKLKPMLYFHLPFATLEETQTRAFSLYLLSQYIKWKKGEIPDWEMKNLNKIYEELQILNHNVSQKIAELESKDTSINSLIILNNFADYITFTLDEKLIDELELYLREFLN